MPLAARVPRNCASPISRLFCTGGGKRSALSPLGALLPSHAGVSAIKWPEWLIYSRTTADRDVDDGSSLTAVIEKEAVGARW
jgi:hypothetical protein